MKKSNKQRDTRQRRIVYEVVTGRCDHPTADDIYTAVHEIDAKISKGTVYRNLNLLAENGEINYIQGAGAGRFDKTLGEHYHIVCTECGRVADAPLDYAEARDREVEKETGFAVSRHVTVFEGICPECRKKNEKENLK